VFEREDLVAQRIGVEPALAQHRDLGRERAYRNLVAAVTQLLERWNERVEVPASG
jgi:hypothetical protein